jgi:hypothetical protein
MNNFQEIKRNELVAFLQQRSDLVPQLNQPYWLHQYNLLTPEQYAQVLLGDAEFRALQLGTWLGTTDGEVINQAVEQIIPPFYRPEYDFMIKGLTLAASLQAQEGQQVAGKVALSVIGVGLFFAGLAYLNREAA